MTTFVTEDYISVDIENNVQTENPITQTRNNQTINNQTRKTHTKDNDLFSKICVSFWITVILSPVIICDLYFAVNDKSCVNQTFDTISINMYIWLIVNSITLIILILVTYIVIFILDSYESLTECTFCFSKFIGNTINVFLFVWFIIGCVIYWGFMDTSKCSKNVNNYLFVQFVITIITIASIIINFCKKNN